MFERRLAGVAGAPHRDPRRRRRRAGARCASARASRQPTCTTTLDTRRAGAPPSRRSATTTGKAGDRRRAAVDRRHPRRRQPPGGLDVRPRARGRLRAGLDVQGDQHRRAAARRPRHRASRRLPADEDRRRRDVQATSRASASGAGRRSRATSRSRATPRSSRSPAALPPNALQQDRARLRPRPHAQAAGRHGATPGPARRRRGQPRRGDDRPGQDRRHPLAMAGVAATVADGRWHAPRLLATDPRRTGPQLAAERAVARCATLMRSVVTAAPARRCRRPRRGRRQERHRRVRRRRPADHPRLVHRLPRRPRDRRARREGPLGRLGRRADRRRASSPRSARQPPRGRVAWTPHERQAPIYLRACNQLLRTSNYLTGSSTRSATLSCIVNKEASAELLQTVADLDLSFTQVKSLLVLRDSDGLAVKDLGARLEPVAPRGEPGRRPARPARPGRAHGIRRGPPLAPRGPAPRRPRADGRVHPRAHERPRALGRVAPRRPAGRAPRRPPPHRRKDLPPVTQRIRLSEENRRWWTLGGDVLRAVHGHARQHRRERRAAVDPARLRRLALRPSSGRSTPTRSCSPSCSSPAAASATSSAAVRMFLFGVVVFAPSRRAIGFAPDEGWLVACRAVQGVGAALMMPGTLSIISNAFPPAERGKAIGTWAGVSAIALALGPLRRRLADRGRLLARDLLPQPPRRRRRDRRDAVRRARVARRDRRRAQVDIPGIATLTDRPDRARARARRGQRVGLGLAARSSRCSRSRSSAWSRSCSIERTLARADRRLRRSSARARSWARTSSRSRSRSAMLAMFFFLALYMQNILGYIAARGRRALPALDAVIIVAGPIAGRLADRDRPAPADRRGLLLVAVSLAWQSRHPGRHELRASWSPAFILLGRRHGLHDVADEHGGDERRRPHEGRRRVGHAVDDPHGRRHVRRRRARRAGGRRRPPRLAQSLPQRARRRRASGSSTALGSGAGDAGRARPQVVDAAHSRRSSTRSAPR